MAVENFLRAGHFLLSSVYNRAHHAWVRKNFHSGSSRVAGKRYFQYGFFKCNIF